MEYLRTIVEAAKEGRRTGHLAFDELMSDDEAINQLIRGVEGSELYKTHPGLFLSIDFISSIATVIFANPNKVTIHKK